MNKKILIILPIIAILVGLVIYFSNNNHESDNPNGYESNKISSDKPSTDNTISNEILQNDKNNTSQYFEEEISTFSTKIYSTDSSRQNNIQITCNLLNNTVVKKGDIFSFCNTVGQATSAKGYQKADIFDKDGNKKSGLGGGNCQVSSTLYNAVLNTPNLIVTERHEHSNNVPYVSKGKDAAIAYGSYDFKFKNNTENDIKIQSYTDEKNVTISIIALKNF